MNMGNERLGTEKKMTCMRLAALAPFGIMSYRAQRKYSADGDGKAVFHLTFTQPGKSLLAQPCTAWCQKKILLV